MEFSIGGNITDEGLQFLSKLLHLKELRLRNLHGITGTAFKSLSIKKMTCEECKSVTEESIYDFFKVNDELEEIVCCLFCKREVSADFLKKYLNALRSRNSDTSLTIQLQYCRIRVTPRRSTNKLFFELDQNISRLLSRDIRFKPKFSTNNADFFAMRVVSANTLSYSRLFFDYNDFNLDLDSDC